MQEALEAALGELVFGAAIDPSDSAAVDAWLSRHRIPKEHAEAIREREIQRLVVYRGLVRGTLRGALEAAIPRSMARLGASFDEYFDRFLAERAPASHYLRDVTTEFLQFCAAPWKSDRRVPAYLYDLARHEALHIEIAAMPRRPAPELGGELDLDAGLQFSEASRLMRYAFAVHHLSDNLEDRSEPEPIPTWLFVYRNPDHDVRYLELTAMAAAIVSRLMDGASLKAALLEASASSGVELDESVLSGAAQLLADLSERGALLGPSARHETRNLP